MEKYTNITSNGEWPSVGVLISVYGGDDQEHFRTALNSLKVQTYPKEALKIYLGVDGPLSEALEDVIEENSDFIYCLSRSEHNVGLAETLNRLIRLSIDCNYLARMDSDDICHGQRIKKQVIHLENNPDVDILGCSIIEFTQNRAFPPRKYPKKDAVLRSIPKASPLAHPSVIFRNTAIKKLERYPEVRGNEDIAMWFKALKIGLIIENLEEPLLYFRVSEGLHSRRGSSKALSEFYEYWRGIQDLGLSPHFLIYPVARLVYRLCPRFFSKILFSKVGMRNSLLK